MLGIKICHPSSLLLPDSATKHPQHATADLHMLAVKIASPCLFICPRCTVCSPVYCLIQTEFHQLGVWNSGFRTDRSLDSLFWVTQNRPLPSTSQKYASERHLSKHSPRRKTCLDNSAVFLHGAAGITFIYLRVKQ